MNSQTYSIFVCIICVVVTIFVATQLSNAQTFYEFTQLSNAQTFYELAPNESSLGLDFNFHEDGTIIGGELQYAIDKETIALFGAGIGFRNKIPKISFPPSPSAAIRIGRRGQLEQTMLGYFSSIGGFAGSAREINSTTDKLLKTTVNYGISADFGVFQSIELSGDGRATPFFGVSYTYSWSTTGRDYDDLNFYKAIGADFFAGTLGMELQFSSKYSMVAAIDFSFDQPDRTTRIGINLY